MIFQTTIPLEVSMPTVAMLLHLLPIVTACTLLILVIFVLAQGRREGALMKQGMAFVLGIVCLTVMGVLLQSLFAWIGQRNIERTSEIVDMPVISVLEKQEAGAMSSLNALVGNTAYEVICEADEGPATYTIRGDKLASEIQNNGVLRFVEFDDSQYLLSDQSYNQPDQSDSASNAHETSNDDVFFLWAWLTLMFPK